MDDVFNSRLHKLRKMRGFTLKYLGDCAGFAESTMCQYEAGNREPNIETLTEVLWMNFEPAGQASLFERGAGA